MKKYNNSPRIRTLEAAAEELGRTQSSDDFFSRDRFTQNDEPDKKTQTQPENENENEIEVDTLMERDGGQEEITSLETWILKVFSKSYLIAV